MYKYIQMCFMQNNTFIQLLYLSTYIYKESVLYILAYPLETTWQNWNYKPSIESCGLLNHPREGFSTTV